MRLKAWGGILAMAAMLAGAAPAAAQFSDSYNFLKAIRDKDGQKVTEFLQGGGGATIINTKDITTGESAVHIVIKRRDDTWLRFLLEQGANPNIRDKNGNTPLVACAQIGFAEGLAALIAKRADVNLPNDQGETPLIVAVQRRDLIAVRLLLEARADANRADHIAGLSARDYAARDPRAAPILRAIDDAAKTTKPAPAKVSGPGL